MKLVFDLTLLGLYHNFKTCYEYSKKHLFLLLEVKGGFETPATSKIEPFVTKVNGWKPFTTAIRNFILEFAWVLDLPLKKALNALQKQPSRGVSNSCFKNCLFQYTIYRARSRTTARSKWELYVTIINGWKPLTHKGLPPRLCSGSRSTSDLVLLFLFFMPNYFPTHSPWPILERDCKGCDFCEKGQEIVKNSSKDPKTLLFLFSFIFFLVKACPAGPS